MAFLKQSLEQVRRCAIDPVPRASTSETADFAEAVEAWIKGDDSKENPILDYLSTHGRTDGSPAYCEEASREHNVCHVNFGRNGERWLEIDAGGNVLDLS